MTDVDLPWRRRWGMRRTICPSWSAGDEVQDFTPGAILKGKVSSTSGDDFVVELGLKSEGVLERVGVR